MSGSGRCEHTSGPWWSRTSISRDSMRRAAEVVEGCPCCCDGVRVLDRPGVRPYAVFCGCAVGVRLLDEVTAGPIPSIRQNSAIACRAKRL